MEGRGSFYFVHFFRKRPIHIEGIRKTTVYFFFSSKLSSLFSCPLSLTKNFVLLITSIAENYSGGLAQVYYRLSVCFSSMYRLLRRILFRLLQHSVIPRSAVTLQGQHIIAWKCLQPCVQASPLTLIYFSLFPSPSALPFFSIVQISLSIFHLKTWLLI